MTLTSKEMKEANNMIKQATDNQLKEILKKAEEIAKKS
jgi:hypothetical protein